MIGEKSPEMGNLSKDPSDGHLVKASIPDFRTSMFQECIKTTISEALIGVKEDLVKELGRGRHNLKRQKEDAIPTAPQIFGKNSKRGDVPINISLTTCLAS